MTIRRRLFVSNTLMLVIPILISLAVIGVSLLAAMSLFDPDDRRDVGFPHAVEQIRAHAREWLQSNDIEQIKLDMQAGWKDMVGRGISLSIYQNGELIQTSGYSVNNRFIEIALKETGEHHFAIDQTEIYKIDIREYTILAVNTNPPSVSGILYESYYRYMDILIVALVVIIILIIIITNRLLTRMVFKRITLPLDMLVFGVHQIRDGNLDYRIAYESKDEFEAVCADFNEMAVRLMDMVNARQRDEENRKELIAGISHDLRTPLTSIKTYVEGIELGIASTTQVQKKYLDTIKNKTKDLEHIINQLFLFSKLDIGEFPMQIETIDIGKFLSEFTKAVSGEYEQKGLQIDFIGDVQCALINVDKAQFSNILVNVLENSVKYGNADPGIMRISYHTDNNAVTISLTDNGPGVPEDTLERLLDIFYRGDKARSNTSQGSGLGLAISAKIMELLGGTISLENASDGGLSVILIFPAAKGDSKNEKNTDY